MVYKCGNSIWKMHLNYISKWIKEMLFQKAFANLKRVFTKKKKL